MPLPEAIYSFDSISASEANSYVGNLLQSDALHGVVVTDFLNSAEVLLILDGFRKLTDEERINVVVDFVSYPESFAQFTQKVDAGLYAEDNYYRFAQEYVDGFKTRFGVDVVQKLRCLMETFFPAHTVSVPHNKNGTGCFIPFNFRELKPGKGELMVHCENLFFNEFPQFFEKLNHLIIKQNEYSFFMVLQTPERGGELCLYDLQWPEYNNRVGHKHIQHKDGSLLHEDDVALTKQLIDAPEGAIVIFKGGTIWHRINVVEGHRSRITLGGFISSASNAQQLYFWS